MREFPFYDFGDGAAEVQELAAAEEDVLLDTIFRAEEVVLAATVDPGRIVAKGSVAVVVRDVSVFELARLDEFGDVAVDVIVGVGGKVGFAALDIPDVVRGPGLTVVGRAVKDNVFTHGTVGRCLGLAVGVEVEHDEFAGGEALDVGFVSHAETDLNPPAGDPGG